jgi:Ni/Co efflux regulator RcnB
MNRNRILAAALATAFALAASAASADPRGHRDGPRAENHRGGYDHGKHRVPPGHAKRQRTEVHHHHYQPAPVVRHVHAPVPYYRFHRGDRLPVDYRRPQYVVEHWHDHRLSPPPRHHHWVQVGSDYLLVAIASGIVAHAILSH